MYFAVADSGLPGPPWIIGSTAAGGHMVIRLRDVMLRCRSRWPSTSRKS